MFDDFDCQVQVDELIYQDEELFDNDDFLIYRDMCIMRAEDIY